MNYLKTVIVIVLTFFALGTAFVANSRCVSPQRLYRTDLQMGGKMSKFGIFSPAVYAAKFVLGEKKLEKVGFCSRYYSSTLPLS